jgi:hypothetical protein
MAGGSLQITTESWNMAPAVAQRLLCWMTADSALKTDSSKGGAVTFVVPEESFGAGALVMLRGGTNIVAGYVAGSNITFAVGNGDSIEQNANSCPASTNQPTLTGAGFITGVGGNPLATTLTYANVGGSGVVDILWGDGTSTLGAAESGSSSHTYPNNGYYYITVRDASVLTDLGVTGVHVP